MAIIVETGAGVKNAVSYAAMAEFEAYMLARGTDISALTTAVKEAALVKATDYIDTRWGLRLKGRRYFLSLESRSNFTLTDQPSDGETVTVGNAVATFKTTATLDTHAEIGTSLAVTLGNLAEALGNADDPDDREIVDFLLADIDVATLTVFTVKDGIGTTEAVTNGSFDGSTSAGKSGHQQPLQFPRIQLTDDAGVTVQGIPAKLKAATFEYAYRAQSAALAPDPVIHETGLRLTGEKVQVGPIVTETKLAEIVPTGIVITKPFPKADRLLQEYVSSSTGIIRS